MFSTILIANRGEIALRAIRSCHELGLNTVVVHSTADRDSSVVRAANRAIQIGPAAPRHSYLNIAAVVEAAMQAEADAVYPGYGFLSENLDFAEVCERNGLVFVGPPVDVMARLADKGTARTIMAAAGLPVLPGSEAVDSAAHARAVAAEIGYPALLKASAGGGGRGMIVVRSPDELVRAYAETRAQAQAIFGDGSLYMERFLESVRHVEVQVMADGHGNAVHLGERDCSVQRRNQKLVEETPAPGLSRELTARMAEAAVRGARAVGYEGAGTFEFLVDQDGRFFFMEINCRIQVEHPVTEMACGVDIVREQLLVAAGQRLSFAQHDVVPRGVAMECRVNAEDPERNFLPTPGVVEELGLPAGPFVRVDTHAQAGMRVTADYDPLLAKVVVWAPDREQAIARMQRALGETCVAGKGVRTTTGFLAEVLDDPLFRDAKHDTGLVGRMLDAGQADPGHEGSDLRAGGESTMRGATACDRS